MSRQYNNTTASVKFTEFRANKFNEDQKEVSVAFELANGETVYRNYLVEGGPEFVREFSGKDLASLIKVAANSPAGQVPVTTWENDKGYTQINVDFKRAQGAGGQAPADDDAGF